MNLQIALNIVSAIVNDNINIEKNKTYDNQVMTNIHNEYVARKELALKIIDKLTNGIIELTKEIKE